MSGFFDHNWGALYASDWIHAHVCGHGSAAPDALIMFWQAFCDESGDDDWFVVGGYVAAAEEWDGFSREWEGFLSFLPNYMNGVFKMSSLMVSDYFSERSLAFYRLIEQANLISVSCTLRKSDLVAAFDETDWPRERIRNWDKFRQDMVNPYPFAMRAIVLKLCEVQEDLGISEPVDFVFDERSEQRRIQDAWHLIHESVSEDIRNRLGRTPVFDKEDRLPPLQAADLWVWLVRVWEGIQCGEDWAVFQSPQWPWMYNSTLGKGFRVRFDKADLKSEIGKVNLRVRAYLSGESS